MSSSENFAARLALRSGGGDENVPLGQRLATLRHLKRLFQQIWRTSPPLTAAAIGLRLLRAVQPLLLLYVGKLIIDEVVLQTGLPAPGPGFSDWLASGRLTAGGRTAGAANSRWCWPATPVARRHRWSTACWPNCIPTRSAWS